MLSSLHLRHAHRQQPRKAVRKPELRICSSTTPSLFTIINDIVQARMMDRGVLNGVFFTATAYAPNARDRVPASVSCDPWISSPIDLPAKQSSTTPLTRITRNDAWFRGRKAGSPVHLPLSALYG